MKHKTKSTVLAVGDKSDFDAFQKFYRERKLFRQNKLNFRYVNYSNLLKNKNPGITTREVIVLLFFPFEYWNKKIETKRYHGIYGNKMFYIKFKRFWEKVELSLKRAYPDKQLFFLNHPKRVGDCRDKVLIKKIISKAGIPTPRLYNTKSCRKICEHINKGKNLFIKVRFGSMGKGLTFLNKDNWYTNFDYHNNRIISRKSDYGWRFREVSGNLNFLKKLLKTDVIVEEAVEGFLIRDRIFDLRLYVFFNDILFIYPRTNNRNNIITNISQGARGESSRFLRHLSKKLITKTVQYAQRAAQVMGLNFAGVDVLVGSNGKDIYVLEVNAFPGFPRNNIFNLSKHMINFLSQERYIIQDQTWL